MSDRTGPEDPGAIWRDQPEERRTVDLEQILKQRTDELYSSTRSEILMSILAALLFIGVMAWRLGPAHDRLGQLGFAAAILWVIVSLYWFRYRIRRRSVASGCARRVRPGILPRRTRAAPRSPEKRVAVARPPVSGLRDAGRHPDGARVLGLPAAAQHSSPTGAAGGLDGVHLPCGGAVRRKSCSARSTNSRPSAGDFSLRTASGALSRAVASKPSGRRDGAPCAPRCPIRCR